MGSRSKGGARSAASGLPLSSSTGDPLPPFPDKRKWPSYSPAQVELIGEFLSVYHGHCLEGLRRAEQLAALDPEDPYAKSMIVRWTYGAQVCHWMLTKLPQRQRHLALKAYVATHGALPPCGPSQET